MSGDGGPTSQVVFSLSPIPGIGDGRRAGPATTSYRMAVQGPAITSALALYCLSSTACWYRPAAGPTRLSASTGTNESDRSRRDRDDVDRHPSTAARWLLHKRGCPHEIDVITKSPLSLTLVLIALRWRPLAGIASANGQERSAPAGSAGAGGCFTSRRPAFAIISSMAATGFWSSTSTTATSSSSASRPPGSTPRGSRSTSRASVPVPRPGRSISARPSSSCVWTWSPRSCSGKSASIGVATGCR